MRVRVLDLQSFFITGWPPPCGALHVAALPMLRCAAGWVRRETWQLQGLRPQLLGLKSLEVWKTRWWNWTSATSDDSLDKIEQLHSYILFCPHRFGVFCGCQQVQQTRGRQGWQAVWAASLLLGARLAAWRYGEDMLFDIWDLCWIADLVADLKQTLYIDTVWYSEFSWCDLDHLTCSPSLGRDHSWPKYIDFC